jgi:hypothetical protein
MCGPGHAVVVMPTTLPTQKFASASPAQNISTELNGDQKTFLYFKTEENSTDGRANVPVQHHTIVDISTF